MRILIPAGLCLLTCLYLPVPAGAADLQGRVSFQPLAGDDSPVVAADTVIFFKPDQAPVVKAMTAEQIMTMQDKSFVPHVLVITAGSEVRFPNADPIFHNVFSPSAPNDFDMGLYDTSGGKAHVFLHPGLVHVYCNVHRDMFGYILVLDTPYYTSSGADGSFSLHGVPPGPGQLLVWNPRTEVWRQRLVDGDAAQRFSVLLTLLPGGVPEHMNKDGKAYFHHRSPGT
jgi:plastocyanin